MTKHAESTAQFVFTKYLLLIGGIIVTAGLSYLTVWSFFQTRDWFKFVDDPNNRYMLVSLSLSLVFQYGQGVVLFLRLRFSEREKYFARRIENYPRPPTPQQADAYERYKLLEEEKQKASWAKIGFGLVFWVFAIVDGYSNVAEMWKSPQVAGIAEREIFTLVIGSVMVFIEEGLGFSLSIIGHTYNDILMIHGGKRLPWLDVFSQGAVNLLSGGVSVRNEDRRWVGSRRPGRPLPASAHEGRLRKRMGQG